MKESRIWKYIPSPREECETFYIKGLALPHRPSERCLTQLVSSYYAENENVVVFASSFEGKSETINEITQNLENYVVFSDTVYFGDKLHLFSKELLAGKKYLIFYNVSIPFQEIENIGEYHISAFYTYNLDSYEDYTKKYQSEYIENLTKDYPADFRYTIVCKEPKKKVVDFRFGTDDEVKHICLGDISINSLAYSKKKVTVKFPNILFITEIPEKVRIPKFIFYDLNVEKTLDILKAVDDVVFVYTTKDFPVLKKIVKVVEDFGLKVSDDIQKVVRDDI